MEHIGVMLLEYVKHTMIFLMIQYIKKDMISLLVQVIKEKIIVLQILRKKKIQWINCLIIKYYQKLKIMKI